MDLHDSLGVWISYRGLGFSEPTQENFSVILICLLPCKSTSKSVCRVWGMTFSISYKSTSEDHLKKIQQKTWWDSQDLSALSNSRSYKFPENRVESNSTRSDISHPKKMQNFPQQCCHWELDPKLLLTAVGSSQSTIRLQTDSFLKVWHKEWKKITCLHSRHFIQHELHRNIKVPQNRRTRCFYWLREAASMHSKRQWRKYFPWKETVG